ncbi:hypothetical protein KI688_006863 [Linnemannia hyalina]|uniref:Uncharacterized protein n=1 Tax=Linnemannia hyalina TaxID=64524 RepID=A0A9P7XJJ3_9FUNG|nr:hypothetical protein KI688_006863 [Linnemannia hyalina]
MPEQPQPTRPVNRTNALMMPEIIALVGQYLPLFVHRFEIGWGREGIIWSPKTLRDAATVCRAWHSVLTGVLWHTYDHALMVDNVSPKVLGRNMHLVRRLSLMDEYLMWPYYDRTPLQQALSRYQHISCLEVSEEIFLHQSLSELNAESLSELKLTGYGLRMGVAMMLAQSEVLGAGPVQVYTHGLEEAGHRKASSPKLVVLERCVLSEIFSGIRPTEEPPRGEDIVMEDAADIGTLPITHLVINDRVFSFALREISICASPGLKQLETSLLKVERNQNYAELIRDHCQELEVLAVHSKHMTWTQEMVKKMPQSIRELVLHLKHYLLDVAGTIAERGASLTRLELDFAEDFIDWDDRHLSRIGEILRGCSELQEFVYHHHIHDHFVTTKLLKDKWNLPHLKALRLHGLHPDCIYVLDALACKDVGPQTPNTVPLGWRRNMGEPYCDTCYIQKRGEAMALMKGRHAPFEAVLLCHVQKLPSLSEVVLTENVYKR